MELRQGAELPGLADLDAVGQSREQIADADVATRTMDVVAPRPALEAPPVCDGDHGRIDRNHRRGGNGGDGALGPRA